MGTHYFGVLTYSGQGTLDHFMGYRIRKDNQKIRRSDPAFHICAGLAEHFRFTSVFTADIRILSFHTLISTENHYAHYVLLRLWLGIANLCGNMIRRPI